jgi:hypothetical protein
LFHVIGKISRPHGHEIPFNLFGGQLRFNGFAGVIGGPGFHAAENNYKGNEKHDPCFHDPVPFAGDIGRLFSFWNYRKKRAGSQSVYALSPFGGGWREATGEDLVDGEKLWMVDSG